MDDKDRLLVSLLRRDARRPTVALARDLGLSRSATQERLAKLQSSGALAGFTIVEPAAPHSAYLSIRFAPGQDCARVVPRLKAIPAIAMIHSLTGSTDLLVRVDGPDIAAIEAARREAAAVPGVAEVQTAVVLERHLG